MAVAKVKYRICLFYGKNLKKIPKRDEVVYANLFRRRDGKHIKKIRKVLLAILLQLRKCFCLKCNNFVELSSLGITWRDI